MADSGRTRWCAERPTAPCVSQILSKVKRAIGMGCRRGRSAHHRSPREIRVIAEPCILGIQIRTDPSCGRHEIKQIRLQIENGHRSPAQLFQPVPPPAGTQRFVEDQAGWEVANGAGMRIGSIDDTLHRIAEIRKNLPAHADLLEELLQHRIRTKESDADTEMRSI